MGVLDLPFYNTICHSPDNSVVHYVQKVYQSGFIYLLGIRVNVFVQLSIKSVLEVLLVICYWSVPSNH